MVINKEPALTFDDVLLKPGYAGFSRSEIDLSTNVTTKIPGEIPLISAPMDTVTEYGLASELGRLGGFGIIHRNLTIDEQVAEVAKVKLDGARVGAAVGSSPGYEHRLDKLVESGVDAILIDSAHGYAQLVLNAVAYTKKLYGDKVSVIGGNVATRAGAQALIDAGVDALRVGMGPGAICTTRIVSGMGVPQLTAIQETVAVAAPYGIPVIADGGIRNSGDMVKALAAGASSIMMGRLFAAAEESPTPVVPLKRHQIPARFRSIVEESDDPDKSYPFKGYRGMGSLGAMEKGKAISSEDEFHGKSFAPGTVLVPEGVEGLVPCAGSLKQIVAEMLEGIKSGFYYTGARTIDELWHTAEAQIITQASLTESHPHDLFITDRNSYTA